MSSTVQDAYPCLAGQSRSDPGAMRPFSYTPIWPVGGIHIPSEEHGHRMTDETVQRERVAPGVRLRGRLPGWVREERRQGDHGPTSCEVTGWPWRSAGRRRTSHQGAHWGSDAFPYAQSYEGASASDSRKSQRETPSNRAARTAGTPHTRATLSTWVPMSASRLRRPHVKEHGGMLEPTILRLEAE